MGKQKLSDVSNSPIMPKTKEDDLSFYMLKKIANSNAEDNRIKLTNLYNISSFYYIGDDIMTNHPELKFAVIRMDIYRFKTVNELCGWSEGDKLLIYIADILRKYESEVSLVSHIRADIFAMLLPFKEKSELVNVVQDIKNQIENYPINCKILPAFGICVSNPTVYISKQMDYANLALQSIKGKVFSFYSFYNKDMRENLLDEKRIENEIAGAIKNRDIKVYIQPKVNMTNGKIIGGEALVRWIHPEDGLISPDRFVPVLERSGYIINLDIYVWEQVIKAIKQWQDRKLTDIPISVNVSRLHAYQKDFIPLLKEMIKKYQINPSRIPLEVTESAFTKDSQHLFECVEQLQELGFKFSMDDFGSGYSSLNMLKDEPVDEVKIDRIFVKDIGNSKRSQIVVRNVIHMIHELDIDMIAEGVETKEQADLLISYGCTKAQGFYFYKPMPLEEFEKLMCQQS